MPNGKQADGEIVTTRGQMAETEGSMRLLELCQVIADARAIGAGELAARWWDVALAGPVSAAQVEQAEQELRSLGVAQSPARRG